jgi:membrane protein DedA with SNARE-associated domain
MTVFNQRLIAPALGAALSLLAYLGQNVWQVFHVEQITGAIRAADHFGILVGFFLIGVVEATIVLCLYLPGTAIAILLWLSLQPTWFAAAELMACLMAGTLLGFGLSYRAGKVLEKRLPELIGGAHVRRVQTLIERFGLIGVAPVAFHPNNLSFVFAVLGYFRAGRLWAYLAVAAVAQLAWWTLYASAAETISGQTLVTGSNFPLYLVALFAAWFGYELISLRRRT